MVTWSCLRFPFALISTSIFLAWSLTAGSPSKTMCLVLSLVSLKELVFWGWWSVSLWTPLCCFVVECSHPHQVCNHLPGTLLAELKSIINCGEVALRCMLSTPWKHPLTRSVSCLQIITTLLFSYLNCLILPSPRCEVLYAEISYFSNSFCHSEAY